MKLNFSPTKHTVMLYQILAHLALIYMMLTGTATQWLIILGIYVINVSIGGSITLHRMLAHKSFVPPKWFEYLGILIATISNNASTIVWVATHREHHRFSDTEKDPHNPKIHGYLKVQFRVDTYDRLPHPKYIPDLLRSKFHVFLHNYHWLLILSYISILYLIDPLAVLYVFLVPSILAWHGNCLINTLNHSGYGYRSYDTRDVSVNHIVPAILVAGEGWHNNHHADPANPNFGKKWWEFDLSWQIIKLVRLDTPVKNK
jgi:stearoyl-CoA desaturase (delta-9 desaturase)